MTSGQKTALSLLISVILFGAFAVASFAGLFSAIDARFYEGAKISQINQRLQGLASSYDEWLNTLSERFALGENAFLKNPSVQTFVEAKPSQEAALSRGEALGDLRSSTQGLLGFRVIDKNQNSLHYSTFRQDILRRDEKNNLTAYKNYLDCLTPAGNEEIPALSLCASDSGGDFAAGQKLFFDAENRIVFSYPLYDKYSVFRGSAVFYVNALDFANFLLKKNLISIGEDLQFLANGQSGASSLCGYVLGLPSVGGEEFKSRLFDAWSKGSQNAERLFSIDSAKENYWVSLSQKSKSGLFICGVYNDEIFSLPASAKILILICVFISIFLICFLLLNLRRDDETVIRERIRTLQLGVVDEYLSKKEALDWESVSGRREAVTKEIIQSLGRRAKKRPQQVEELINRSWDELFSAMNLKPQEKSSGLENAQEIKAMLQELLSSGSIKVQAAPAPAPAPAKARPAPQIPASAEPVEDLEEVEEVTDAEPVEDLEEVEEVAAAEPVEDLEEVEEIADAEPVEDLEEVEEIADAEPVEDLEEVEEVEEIADAEPVEDLEEVEEIVDAEPVEDLEEVEEIADAEPVEDLEEVEEIADAEPVEDLEEVEEIADAEPVEDLEEVEEIADAEPVEDLEEVEEIADAEPVEDLEEVEEVADAEPVEDFEEVEEVADAEPVEDLEEVEEVADAEPVDDLEEVEEVADAEPVEDLEEVEEVTDAEPVEDLEEVEEVADVEPVEDLEEVEEVAAAEPVEDLEEVEEVADAEPVEDLEEVEEIADAEPVEDLEEVEEVTDAEPVEDLEEVEEVADVDDFEELAASLTNDIAEKKRKSRIPEYDISEDVGSDFFAIKKDKN
ncbi:MAG: hypothetical protein K6A42_10745, partial [Treponema sp.]|nr:hypothetical protein [Treponema sp.]